MSEEKVPVVFISYCWTTSEHMQWVLDLATRLMEKSGVEVILDRWHGVVGHDRYQFMEESIKKADKVIVICDEQYCQKANNRQGGVGTETLIITPDVYQYTKQEKFIPIALKKKDNGDYLLPTYISSRFALGMTKPDDFERDYVQLERLIWQEPQLKPPTRGTKPNFEVNTIEKGKQEQVPILDTDCEDERVVWLLPRGFLLYRDITFSSSSSWACTVAYYDYDGEWKHGTHYHESYSRGWEDNIETQYRKLSIQKSDWQWCRAPLNFLQELREVSEVVDIKDMVSSQPYSVLYYAPGEEIPIPKVPDEYTFYYDTGDLRDLQHNIRELVKNVNNETTEEYHKHAVALRQSTYIDSMKFLGKEHPSLAFIKEIVDEYNQTLSKNEIKTWLEKMESILTTTLNHEWDEWQKELKRKKK
ncbi:SEFIR domain-containing protein [Paenibacillus baimaensis]|uniref:SEFIR domain-containing protein n=1 Tax=Paenibacillus baimaensis TaxID=2982185 RepID=UPI0021D02CB8|nr:SEFIR domain-containing protein [Paenibacillus sp. WQ 127069]